MENIMDMEKNIIKMEKFYMYVNILMVKLMVREKNIIEMVIFYLKGNIKIIKDTVE